jgi:hypothetical protein
MKRVCEIVERPLDLDETPGALKEALRPADASIRVHGRGVRRHVVVWTSCKGGSRLQPLIAVGRISPRMQPIEPSDPEPPAIPFTCQRRMCNSRYSYVVALSPTVITLRCLVCGTVWSDDVAVLPRAIWYLLLP